MDITPVEITVRDLVKDFEDNAENGVRAYGKKTGHSSALSERICL